MRGATSCLCAIALVIVGCGDDESKIPLPAPERVTQQRKAIPRRDYAASELVGKYWAILKADERNAEQKKLLDVARGWYLELKAGGRFSLNFTVPMEGSYSVAGDVVILAVERYDMVTIRELEEMVKTKPPTGKEWPNVDEMRSLEFRAVDKGRNLVMMKGQAIEPGALIFERRD